MSLLSGNDSKIFAKGVIGNVRKVQEDSYGYKLGTPNGDLFVVCDGMGGHVGGAKASSIAVESIINFINKEKHGTPLKAMDGALQYANMQILQYAAEKPDFKGMGTTACIVLMQGNCVWIAHVGDSRIYLYLGQEKCLHRLTKDHSYVQTLVDAGEITDEEAERHPNKNRIMKALGIKPELQPTFNYKELSILPKNGDIFLICSDGLCGMISDHTIERVLGEDLTLQEKGDKLIELAMEGETVQPGGQDNCTVELIEVDDSKWKKSQFKSYNPVSTANKDGHDNWKTIIKNKTVKTIVAILAGLLILGIIGFLLCPGHYNRAIEKATNDTVRTHMELDKALKEHTKRINSTTGINGGDISVTQKQAVAMSKNKKLADKERKEIIEPAIERHEMARKHLFSLQKRQERLQHLWQFNKK